MKNTRYKYELNYLRIALCFLIILTHTMTQYAINNILDDAQMKTLYWIRMAFIIGTSGFIILSQLLVTLNYKALPSTYLIDRLKYILLPYIIMGVLYSYSENQDGAGSFSKQIYENLILGNWYGYFVLVIVQFFVLNYFIYQLKPHVLGSPIIVIVAIAINFIYLYLYQHNELFSDTINHYYPLSQNTFIFGWIGYYFFGSFIGFHYEKILDFLAHNLTLLLVVTTAMYCLFVLFVDHEYTEVSSYTYGILPYSLCMFLLLLKFSTMFQTFMKQTVLQISAYSYFIYLMHPIILSAVYNYTQRFEGHTLIFIPVTLLLVVGCCIGVGNILREFPIFKYLIGKQPYRLETIQIKPH